jgi:RES domain-containing protein
MRLWRISNFADLSGEGGRRAEGRWHERGRPVVYLAEHSALALLEVIVHLEIDPEDLPKNYQLLEIEVADAVSVEEFSKSDLDKQAPGWEFDARISRRLTTPWFAEQRSALLRVPSIVVPHASNFLLNPLHADAADVNIIATTRAEYDHRLFPKPGVPGAPPASD